MAAGLQAKWVAVYVETPAHLRLSEADRDHVSQNLHLAEQLGAETAILSGQSISDEILDYARGRNVSKIIIGKPLRPRWRELLFGSVVDELIRYSGQIDVYVISGQQETSPLVPRRILKRTSDWRAYGQGAAIVALCTGLAWLTFPYFAVANLIMIYLLGVVVVALRCGRGPSIMAAILSVAAFDFFFVSPFLTFTVSDVQYFVTFGVMLVVGLIISTLTAQMRQQTIAARQRERRTAALYALSREFASRRGLDNLLQVAAQHISEVFDSQVALWLPDQQQQLIIRTAHPPIPPYGEYYAGSTTHPSTGSTTKPATFTTDAAEQGVARWVYEHGQMAGSGTDTLPGALSLYLPLVATRGAVGVLGMRPRQQPQMLAPEQLHLLETFANQTALVIERTQLAEEAQQAGVQAETERLRNALLSSISHDLRTPLAAIAGAASSLLEGRDNLPPQTRLELIQTISEEAEWLNRLVHNLLEMTRLESGAAQLNKEWQLLEEVIGVALTRLDPYLRDHPVITHLPANLPLLFLDTVLIGQALINLLDNARKFSPPGSPIEISAWLSDQAVTVEVADRGPGLPPGDEARIFDKFYTVVYRQAQRPGRARGVGLGLTICRGIIEAHGGRIWAENRPGGGAIVRFTLPAADLPPVVEPGAEFNDQYPSPAQ
jgi:two-component system sensor histidine kinase KdpD